MDCCIILSPKNIHSLNLVTKRSTIEATSKYVFSTETDLIGNVIDEGFKKQSVYLSMEKYYPIRVAVPAKIVKVYNQNMKDY